MAKQLTRTEVIARAESLGDVTTFDINPQQVAFRFATPEDYTDFRDWATQAGLSYTFSGRYLTANVFTFGITPPATIVPVKPEGTKVGAVDTGRVAKNPNSIV